MVKAIENKRPHFEAGGPIAAGGNIFISVRPASAPRAASEGAKPRRWYPAFLTVGGGQNVRAPGQRHVLTLPKATATAFGLAPAHPRLVLDLEVAGKNETVLRVSAACQMANLPEDSPAVFMLDVLAGTLILDGAKGEWTWRVPLAEDS
jgi:hypothetical protein